MARAMQAYEAREHEAWEEWEKLAQKPCGRGQAGGQVLMAWWLGAIVGGCGGSGQKAMSGYMWVNECNDSKKTRPGCVQQMTCDIMHAIMDHVRAGKAGSLWQRPQNFVEQQSIPGLLERQEYTTSTPAFQSLAYVVNHQWIPFLLLRQATRIPVLQLLDSW
eukprot:1160277-Pelagomonas_calceolata.AAC.15